MSCLSSGSATLFPCMLLENFQMRHKNAHKRHYGECGKNFPVLCHMSNNDFHEKVLLQLIISFFKFNAR